MSISGFLVKKGVRAYRKTLKPFKPLHAAVYKACSLLLVPLVEAIEHFQTMKDDPLYFRVELLTSGYERETVRMVRKLVRPGMTVLDIGANVGYYTRMFARLAGDSGKILAFEPNARTCEVLRRNVSMYPHVQAIQLAVADQEGTAVMYDFLSSGNYSLYYDKLKRDWYMDLLSGKELSPRVLNDLPVTESIVQKTTLDSYWARGELKSVDFIKMDIEGAEMSALQGMKRLIQSSPDLVMIMEYYPRGLQLIGVDPLEALDRLRELGFRRIMVLENDGVVDVENKEYVARLVQRLLDSIARVNILCFRNL